MKRGQKLRMLTVHPILGCHGADFTGSSLDHQRFEPADQAGNLIARKRPNQVS